MLVDINVPADCKYVLRIQTGIYECAHWKFEWIFRESNNYPDAYGACDSPEQLLSVLPANVLIDDIPYVISMVYLSKHTQPKVGGWRWHKWGPYVGIQNPQCEYLADEPIIETVWTYSIYQTNSVNLRLVEAT